MKKELTNEEIMEIGGAIANIQEAKFHNDNRVFTLSHNALAMAQVIDIINEHDDRIALEMSNDSTITLYVKYDKMQLRRKRGYIGKAKNRKRNKFLVVHFKKD